MATRQQIREVTKLKDKWETAFYSPILKALKSQISSFVSDVEQFGLNAAQSRLSGQLMNDKVAIVISKLYRLAGIAAARQTMRRLRQEPEVKAGFGYNQEWTTEIENYFRLHLFNKVVIPITETTKRQIAAKISEMIEKGESVEWLIQQVQSDEMTGWRARMIARTESNRAIEYGNKLGAAKSKFKVLKRWVAVKDDRTRHTHFDLDGKVVGEDETFKPGLSFPGDPNAEAKETINCRCHVEYVPIRDKDGRLVRRDGRRIRVNEKVKTQWDEILAALA